MHDGLLYVTKAEQHTFKSLKEDIDTDTFYHQLNLQPTAILALNLVLNIHTYHD